MNLQRATSRDDAFWLSQAGMRFARSGTSSARIVIVSTSRPQEAVPGATTPLDTHLASLPSLDDLVAEFRRSDPGFDEKVVVAREQRHKELLSQAKAGRISRIAVERLAHGWTQKELAARAGMKQPNIARLERIGAPMAVETARKLAEALGLEDYRDLLP